MKAVGSRQSAVSDRARHPRLISSHKAQGTRHKAQGTSKGEPCSPNDVCFASDVANKFAGDVCATRK